MTRDAFHRVIDQIGRSRDFMDTALLHLRGRKSICVQCWSIEECERGILFFEASDAQRKLKQYIGYDQIVDVENFLRCQSG